MLEDDIKIYLKEIKTVGVDSIHLVQDRDHWWILFKRAMNFQLT
jgi:hypothetical protein